MNLCPISNLTVDRGCNGGTLAMGWGSGTVEFPVSAPPLLDWMIGGVIHGQRGSRFAIVTLLSVHCPHGDNLVSC
jgi:hypothetical protein